MVISEIQEDAVKADAEVDRILAFIRDTLNNFKSDKWGELPRISWP